MNSPEAPAATPIAPPDRLLVLDVLRGLALFGMYVVHLNYYEATPRGVEPGPMAAGLEKAIWWFFEGRFYAMFGMLFGVGFAVQLSRADARGDSFVARYLRRLAGLALFGFIAEGIFGYNVLFGYAIWGLPLLLVRRWSVRSLVLLLIACAVSWNLFFLARLAWSSRGERTYSEGIAAQMARNKEYRVARAQFDSAQKSPAWSTVIEGRLRFMPKFQLFFGSVPSGSFTLFLLGLIAFRLGLFNEPEKHRRLIVSLMIGGAVSWGLARAVSAFGLIPNAPPTDAGSLVRTMLMADVFGLIRDQWLAFTYMGAVLLLVARDKAWLERLSFLAWPGRMALTNYMMQVVLVDVLFTPHSLDWRIPAWLVPIGAVMLLAAQGAFARWWLQRYRFGPLEWAWRSITYWRVQPLRLTPPAGVLATA